MSSEPLDPPPPDAPDDSELEDFLAGRSAISAAYRGASSAERAPAALDAAILEVARASPTRATRRLRWLPIAATAASLVLAVSLLINLRRETETRMTEPAPAVFTADESFALDPGTEAMRKDQFDAKHPSEQASSAREASRLREAMDTRERNAAEKRSSLTEAQAALRRERAPMPLAASPPQAAAAAPPAAPPVESAASMTDSSVALMSAHSSESEAKSLEAQDRAASSLQAMDESLSVEVWIDRLRQLRQRDELETLREELKRFVEKYPRYELPPDLLAFAPHPGAAGPKVNPDGGAGQSPPRE